MNLYVPPRNPLKYFRRLCLIFCGPQKGPAERDHVKKHQNRQKTYFDIFCAGQKTSKIVKSVKSNFRLFFGNFRAAPVFRPLLGALINPVESLGLLLAGF